MRLHFEPARVYIVEISSRSLAISISSGSRKSHRRSMTGNRVSSQHRHFGMFFSRWENWSRLRDNDFWFVAGARRVVLERLSFVSERWVVNIIQRPINCDPNVYRRNKTTFARLNHKEDCSRARFSIFNASHTRNKILDRPAQSSSPCRLLSVKVFASIVFVRIHRLTQFAKIRRNQQQTKVLDAKYFYLLTWNNS